MRNNTVNSNGMVHKGDAAGICLEESSNNNELRDNTASNNYCGIRVWFSSNGNRIYNNYFNNSKNGYKNVYDEGNNIWNITRTPSTNIIGGEYLGGNYWNDYTGWDSDKDGFGDTPYNSSGGISTGWDYLPLVVPNRAPTADANGPYTGTEGSVITLNASGSYDPDSNPLQYRWDFDNDSEWDTDWLDDPTLDHTWTDDYDGDIAVEVNDSEFTNIATASVIVSNVAPTADAGADQTVDEGNVTYFSGSYSDPGADDMTFLWEFGDGGTASDQDVTHVYEDNGVYTVNLTVTDDDGGVGTDSLLVTVNNVAPVVDAGADQTVDEGNITYFFGSFDDPGTNDTHTFLWEFGDGANASDQDVTHVYADNGVYTVNFTVTDDDGGIGTDSLLVTVNNVAPNITSLTMHPTEPVEVGTRVNLTAIFTDPGSLDTHNYTIDWGDETIAGPFSATSPVINNHTYATAGIYTVNLTVTDNDGGFDTMMHQHVIVYDPDVSVAGKGDFDSPAGAYMADSSLVGKANFEIDSKYKKGVLEGDTQFNFKDADLKFHSDSYDWMVVTDYKATYVGTGTINKTGNYGFLISVIDAELTPPSTDVDMFRIKIWNATTEEVVYDNNVGGGVDTGDYAGPITPIEDGKIQIKK